MPKVKRGFIEKIGAQNTIRELLSQDVTDPTEIAELLNKQPSLIALCKGNGRQSISAVDVRYFLEDDAQAGVSGGVEQDSKSLQESPRAQALMNTVRERVNGLIHQAESWEYLAKSTLRDIESMQRDWRDAQEDYRKGLIDEAPPYPEKELRATAKIMETHLKLITSVKGDEKVQQLIRAGSVNVKQGVSQEEVFDAVFGTCEVLGVSQQEALRAYSEWMTKSKPIEAEVVERDE